MNATVNGERWRIRFHHVPHDHPTVKLRRKKGFTGCAVERWENRGSADCAIEGWFAIALGSADCGRSEKHYDKEVGRQFSLIRALRRLNEVKIPSDRTITKLDAKGVREIQGTLLTAYIQSDPKMGRFPVSDLWDRGYTSLYHAVFSEKPFKPENYGTYLQGAQPYAGEEDAA